MDTEFVIPLKKEDLLDSDGEQYSVQKIDLNLAVKKIGVCGKAISNIGCSSITEHFDILFSILYDSQDVSFHHLQELWDMVIFPTLQDLRRFIQEYFINDDRSLRTSTLNILKMNSYIISMFMKTYEEKVSYTSDNFITDTKKVKGGRGKGKARSETPWDWNSSKKSAFSLLNGILEENLNLLFDPPVVEDQFVNLIANCCYKAYESPEIIQAKMKPLRDAISQVLAVLVNQYNHELTFIPQCVQLLKQHEHVVSALSVAVLVMVLEYKCTSLLPKILKEMIEAVRDEEVQGLGKSCAAFITSLSESNPEILLPSIRILTRCLTFEHYMMRNAVLFTFSEIVLKCFSKEELPERDKKMRTQILKYLHNHLRDQSSYVQSKVLQIWSKLASEHAIPGDMLMPVLRSAKSRLADSSSHVVKSAIQFFIVILKENPYAGNFNLVELKNQLLKAQDTLKALQSKHVLSGEKIWSLLEADLVIQLNMMLENDQELKQDVVPSEGVDIVQTMVIITQLLQQRKFVEAFTLLKICEIQFPDSKEIRCNIDRSDAVEYYITTLKKIFMITSKNYNPQAAECDRHEIIVGYLEDTIAFALLISEASKEIERPLYGQSSMEATEAIEFFSTAYQFGAGDSKRVVKNMIMLIWSKTPVIKEAVISACKTLYLVSNQQTLKGRNMQISKRLMKLLKESDYEQKCALEELIHNWFQNKGLDKEFIQVLWEKFSKMYPQLSDEDSIAALMLIDMIAVKNPQLVSSNIQVLIDNGLNKSDNLFMVENTCNILSKLSENKIDGKYLKLPSDHEIFTKLTDIVCSKFEETSSKGYLPMVVAGLKMIYKICCYPFKVVETLLERLNKILVQLSDKIVEKADDGSFPYNEALLASLFHIYGEAIFRKWQYLDKDVFNGLKKDVNALSRFNDSPEDEFEVENQEAANDALSNAITDMCEQCLYLDNSLDAHMSLLVVKVSYGMAVSPILATAAASALAKLMMVSNTFCENNIQIFVTIMEKSTEETVRANSVLGFGDLVMRFPNVLDPWTSHLYGRLHDTSFQVRENTVVVLCHLITREMVKVRGQIAELCLCLEDIEPAISGRVRNLLTMLSQKGNTLYNVVPDIISRLSNPEREEPLSTPVFNRILKFVLGLMGKERQNDLLVEKLCTRLKESNNENQWAQLSYCLAQLSYSEKSLKKLIDCLPSLTELILCPQVYDTIESIFTNATKAHFTKPEFKEIAADGISTLEEILTVKRTVEEKDGNEDSIFVEPSTPRMPITEKKSKSVKRTTETPQSSRKHMPLETGESGVRTRLRFKK